MKEQLLRALRWLVARIDALFAGAIVVDAFLAFVEAWWLGIMISDPTKFDRGALAGTDWLPDRFWMVALGILAFAHLLGFARSRLLAVRFVASFGSAWLWIFVAASLHRVETSTGVGVYSAIGALALLYAIHVSGQRPVQGVTMAAFDWTAFLPGLLMGMGPTGVYVASLVVGAAIVFMLAVRFTDSASEVQARLKEREQQGEFQKKLLETLDRLTASESAARAAYQRQEASLELLRNQVRRLIDILRGVMDGRIAPHDVVIPELFPETPP